VNVVILAIEFHQFRLEVSEDIGEIARYASHPFILEKSVDACIRPFVLSPSASLAHV